jgi:hypothetical protein
MILALAVVLSIPLLLQVDECGATELGEATLHNFTTFGNGIHGVELSVVGHVRLSGFKVADNVENGIEIQETHGEWGGPRVMVWSSRARY